MNSHKKQIGIGWQVGLPSGWGTYGTNLAVDLVRRGMTPELFFVADTPAWSPSQRALLAEPLAGHADWRNARRAGDVSLAFPVLHALGDKLDWPPVLKALHGAPDIGVVFFESAVIPQANIEAASRFAMIVTGSTWNTEVLKRHGLTNVKTCFQGVDLDLFTPGAVPGGGGRFEGRFTVFSGGKLEYRKGQDLVVAAFKKFHARHPDALLVTAWHNPWPQAAQGLAMSAHVSGPPPLRADGTLDVAGWLRAEGLSDDAFVDVGPLANTETPELLHQVDAAVLPSRCEGGTNLVAMECMACGVPTILSRNTGHLDLIAAENTFPLDFQIPMGEVMSRPDLDGWGESSIEEIVTRLEDIYNDRGQARMRGAAAAAFMQNWGWSRRIGKLLEAIDDIT